MKSHEFFKLAGPLGKYALENTMATKWWSPISEYLDFLGRLCAKTMSKDDIARLKVNARVHTILWTEYMS